MYSTEGYVQYREVCIVGVCTVQRGMYSTERYVQYRGVLQCRGVCTVQRGMYSTEGYVRFTKVTFFTLFRIKLDFDILEFLSITSTVPLIKTTFIPFFTNYFFVAWFRVVSWPAL